jgi:excinuclease ABC subunit C
VAASKKEKPDLQKKVHEVPHKPGVYLMRDRFNRVIYVGKARDLRKRVSSYFLPSKLAQADLKTRALLDATWNFETHTVRSEAESVLLEGKLIKEYRPRYNISFRDDKRFLVVRVDLSEEWPRFRLARFKKDDGSRYFGPYAHAGALRQTLNFMRKKFGVLTFGRGAPTERELKSSTYQVPVRLSETGAEQYRERVAQACEFLEGKSREMITALEEQMHAAAEKMDFEKAAELRNMVADLRNTTRPTRRFTRGSLPSIIDPTADVQALADALHLPDAPRVMECFDISNISTTHVVRRWFVSGMGFRTRTITAATACAPSKGRMILPAWPRSCDGGIRGFCLRREPQIPTQRNFRRKMPRMPWREFPVIPSKVEGACRKTQSSCRGIPRLRCAPLGMTRALLQFAYPT